jgi:hypothetical protein
MTLPLVRLHNSIGLSLIVFGPSGVRYSNQTGGHGCLQPEVEGFHIPIRNDLTLSPVELLGPEPDLRAHFIGPKHRGLGALSGLDAEDVAEISRIPQAHQLADVISVDLARLAESHEAWVYVHVLRDDGAEGFSGFGPYPRPGVLTWANSD